MASSKVNDPVGLSVKRNNTISLRISEDYSGPIHKFISIIGAPPPPSDSRETGHSTAILPAANPCEVVDVLDAMDEDPFTLETFESMINLHAEKELDFLIARVQTVDPDDDSRFYYSYYAAHHINKVLFRAQPEEGLLHRMRAKNPLNNMTIIGDVHYYVIKPQKVQSPINFSAAAAISPLDTIINLVLPSDSPATKRAKSINSHFSSSSSQSSSVFSQLLNIALPSKPQPLQFMIKQEAYESDIELQTRAKTAKKRNSFDDAYSDISPNFRPVTNSKASVLKKGPETVNRHRNVRSVAYSNERTNSMTVDDWVRIKNLPSPEAIVMSASTRIAIDEGSPRRRKASPSTQSPPSIEANSSAADTPNKFYVAMYYASDDDFLMHGSVRSYFKLNAFEDQDHVLFTILPQSENAGDAAHPTLANLSLFLGSPESRAQSKFRRMLKWLMLVYFIVSALIVRYLVPTKYQYLVGFLLFFFFTLFLIVSL